MKIRLISLMALSAACLAALTANARSERADPHGKAAQRVEAIIWADGEIYDSILTSTSFTSPPSHSVDVLYNFDMSGLSGQRPVSESAPGDSDYNGGRWWVNFVIFTELGKMVHDPDEDGIVNFELTSAEAVLHHANLGHLTIMESSTYFECPLLKSRS